MLMAAQAPIAALTPAGRSLGDALLEEGLPVVDRIDAVGLLEVVERGWPAVWFAVINAVPVESLVEPVGSIVDGGKSLRQAAVAR